MQSRVILSMLLAFSFSNIYSQYVSISEILDANLFKLADGRIVKLAGVDAPSCSSFIPYLRKVADNAKSLTYDYQRAYLSMDSISYDSDHNYLLVFLYRNYPLGRMNLSEKLLYNGYGKYIRNFQSPDSLELIYAEECAKKNQLGIWKFFTPSSEDIIDSTLSKSGIASVLIPDSTKSKNCYQCKSIFISIPIELFAGSAVTVGSMFVGGGIGYLFNTNDRWGGLGGAAFGLAAGYLIGFPWTIYQLASNENPNLNLWINFGCSWGLTLITGLAAAVIKEGHHPINIIAGLSPIIGSLLYVHLFAPQNPAGTNSFLKPEFPIQSFKDFRDAQTMKLELFRINF